MADGKVYPIMPRGLERFAQAVSIEPRHSLAHRLAEALLKAAITAQKERTHTDLEKV